MAIGLPINLNEMIAHGKNSPMDYLKAIINDYFAILSKPKYEAIFNRRLDEEKNTLDSVAVDFQITRERTRQIYQLQYDTITSLLKGKTIEKPLCYAHPHVLNWIYGSVDFTKTIVLKGHIMDIMGASIDDENINGYLDFMMQVKNFHRQYYKSMEFYVSPKADANIERICKEILWYLKKCPMPVPIDKVSKDTRIMSWMIKDVEFLIPSILKTDDGRYYLTSGDLISRGDRAYRLLKEVGKPLHYKEINKRLGINIDNTSGYMIKDNRMVNMGRSGMWALKEWNLDNRSLTDVLTDALKMLGRPTTVREITKCVKVVVPNTSVSKVDAHLRMSTKFCWTANGKICLSSWRLPGTKSKKPFMNKEKCPVPVKEFTIKLMNAIGDQELSQADIVKSAVGLFPEIKTSTIYWRVYFSPGLIREKRDGMNYFKVNKSYVPKESLPRGYKTEELIKEVTAILKKEGSKKRSDLIRIMAGKGYSKPLVFKTLLRCPAFSVKVYNKKKTVVSLAK